MNLLMTIIFCDLYFLVKYIDIMSHCTKHRQCMRVTLMHKHASSIVNVTNIVLKYLEDPYVLGIFLLHVYAMGFRQTFKNIT